MTPEERRDAMARLRDEACESVLRSLVSAWDAEWDCSAAPGHPRLHTEIDRAQDIDRLRAE